MSALAAVDVGHLFQVVWVSLAAGVGVTAIFSLVVYAGSRSSESRREGDQRRSAVFGAVALLAFALFLGCVVLGVTSMLEK